MDSLDTLLSGIRQKWINQGEYLDENWVPICARARSIIHEAVREAENDLRVDMRSIIPVDIDIMRFFEANSQIFEDICVSYGISISKCYDSECEYEHAFEVSLR